MSNGKTAAGVVTLAVDIAEFLTDLTDTQADDAIVAGVRHAVDLWKRGSDGKISPEAASLGLSQLHERLAAGRKQRDERLRDKFDPETTGDG